MKGKTWHITLSPASVAACIVDLKSYARSIEWKCETLRRRVALLMADVARKGFAGAIVDDLTEQTQDAIGEGPREAHVNVTVEWDGDGALVVAHGTDAIWVEFGAGVFHNGSVGQSPNPLSAQNGLGFTIGGYSRKEPKDKEKWAFVENGQTLWSYGTPANMPLYHAVLAARDQIADIAREVFEQR